MKDKYLLGQILIQQGCITKGELYEALNEQKDKKSHIGKLLVEKGYATPEDICKALAIQLGITYVKLSDYQLNQKAIYVFPDRVVKEHRVLPIDIKGDELVVAMADPLNLFSIQEMRHLTNYKIVPVLTTEKELDKFISEFFGRMRDAIQAIEEIDVQKQDDAEGEISVEKLRAAVSEAPIIRLVNSIIGVAVEQLASDIHLEPQEDKMVVRYRIDGILYDRMEIPKNLQATVVSRIKIMAGMDIGERRRPQDGRIGLEYAGRTLDLRVSTLPVIYGEKTVIRILDKTNFLLGIESLGMNPAQLDTFTSFIARPHGIILVTGPTGSGKTTTLYAALSRLNSREKNIITVEDPVEYEIKGINQVSVNTKANITFAKGMKHILRQDPNTIMIGEIRDFETAEIAIQAALTGHLVLSTLHTNDAPTAIIRLMDMKIEPFLIASTVVGIVAQRLVRLLCPHCKKEMMPSEEMLESLREKFSLDGSRVSFSASSGCPKCGSIGYKGRSGIFEIMSISDSIREKILSRSPTKEIEREAVGEGMMTLAHSAIEKALNKATSLQEVMRVIYSAE